MQKLLIILFMLSPLSQLKAQNYDALTDSAVHIVWKAKDSIQQRKALNLFEQAFKLYPSEIEDYSRYVASVSAGKLFELDKAFMYLNVLMKNSERNPEVWKRVVGKFYQTDYPNLLNDPRWKELTAIAVAKKALFFKRLEEDQKEFQSGGITDVVFNKSETGKAVYLKIKNFNNFSAKKQTTYSIKFKVTDSLNTAYFVNLPKDYNPKRKYALLFFLHGGVQGSLFVDYISESVMNGWNRFLTKYAALHQVIMVYPQGSKKYNWMGPDDGFFMVPAILKQIKQSINIDDDKVFVTGHSNGATGSFSYLMKEQNPFAGFYGFNTQPKVRTGGTFIKNILNRSYFNVSTDEDYYYPPGANDSLNVIMKRLGADYLDHRYNGFPHWFPAFAESEPAHQLLFADLTIRKRNPFHQDIYWECDNVKYGKADWIQIDQLDTLGKTPVWHDRPNFNILKLLSYNKQDSLISKDTVLKAFNFPRRSAAVKGYFKNNEFHLETSAVKSLTVFISPEMVDMAKPVIIYINGVKKAQKRPAYNKQVLIDDFNKTYDRKAVWVDQIKITI